MKRKNVKRFLSVAVSLSMLTGMLTGCGGSSDDASKESESSAKTEGESSDGEDELITVTLMCSQSAVQPMSEENKVVELIEEKFNIHLELQLIPDADYTTKRSVALASADLPDIIMGVTTDELRKYAPNGQFLNLYDYADETKDYMDIVNAEDRAAKTKTFEIEDGMYGFQTLEYNRIDLAPLVALRMDRLEEAGLDTPTTWDELYDTMLAIK